MNTNNEQKNIENHEEQIVAGFFNSYKKMVLPNEESFKLFIKNELCTPVVADAPIASPVVSPFAIFSIFSQMKYRVAVMAVFVLLLAGASGKLVTPSSPTPMLALSDVEQTLARIDTKTETEAYAVKNATPATTSTTKKKSSKKVDPAPALYSATPIAAPSPSADVKNLINNNYENEL